MTSVTLVSFLVAQVIGLWVSYSSGVAWYGLAVISLNAAIATSAQIIAGAIREKK